MAAGDIPTFVKHTTVAIYQKGKVGSGKDGFLRAFDIARSKLTEWGYLAKGSETGTIDRIKLVGKGRMREQKHRREGGKGRIKDKLFDELFLLAELELTEKSDGEPQVRSRDERRNHEK